MKAIVVILAIVTGIILGPVQVVYCFQSGEVHERVPITPDEPVSISLSPEMNPVRFNATVTYDKSRIATGRDRKIEFAATLRDSQSREVWHQPFHVTERDDDVDDKIFATTKITVGLNVFDVEKQDDFVFLAKATKHTDLEIKAIELQVRRNARKTHVPSALAGVGLIIAPIVGAFVFRKR